MEDKKIENIHNKFGYRELYVLLIFYIHYRRNYVTFESVHDKCNLSFLLCRNGIIFTDTRIGMINLIYPLGGFNDRGGNRGGFNQRGGRGGRDNRDHQDREETSIPNPQFNAINENNDDQLDDGYVQSIYDKDSNFKQSQQVEHPNSGMGNDNGNDERNAKQ